MSNKKNKKRLDSLLLDTLAPCAPIQQKIEHAKNQLDSRILLKLILINTEKS